jgi:hypothetical protein
MFTPASLLGQVELLHMQPKCMVCNAHSINGLIFELATFSKDLLLWLASPDSTEQSVLRKLSVPVLS